MGKHFLVFLMPILAINSGETDTFTEFDLDYVNVMHEAYCVSYRKCVSPSVSPPTYRVEPSPEPPDQNDGSCCESCSCDLEFCVPTGMCCPDTLVYLPSVEESVSKLKQECIYPSLKNTSGGTQNQPMGKSVWMYTKCADDFDGNPVTRERCEEPGQLTDLDTKLPVVDNITDNTYQNVYCALCNNVSEQNIVYWDASVQCRAGVLLPTSVKTVVDEVNDAPDCNIVYNPPPTGMLLSECTYKISECNVTGRWEIYDPVTEAACHAYTAVFDNEYNNIFCYLCNEPLRPAPGVCNKRGSPPAFISFTALLRFKGPPQATAETEAKDNSCLETQIYDTLKVRHIPATMLLRCRRDVITAR